MNILFLVDTFNGWTGEKAPASYHRTSKVPAGALVDLLPQNTRSCFSKFSPAGQSVGQGASLDGIDE